MGMWGMTGFRPSCSLPKTDLLTKILICRYKLVISVFNITFDICLARLDGHYSGNMILSAFLLLLAIQGYFRILRCSCLLCRSLSVFHLKINMPFCVSFCGLYLDVGFVLTTAEML